MIALISDTNNTLMATYGALLVALIAGAFSLLGLVISKEQKVSEFRQLWIDKLREDIAELIAQMNIIHAELIKLDQEAVRDTRAYLDRTRSNYIDANRSSTRIKLRLNHTEQESRHLLKSIEEMESLLGRKQTDAFDSGADITVINKRIEKHSLTILRAEWKRVKRGEWQYRLAQLVSMILFIGVLLLAVEPWVSARGWRLFW